MSSNANKLGLDESQQSDSHYAQGQTGGKAYFSGPGFRDAIVDYQVLPDGTCIMGGCIDIGHESEIMRIPEGTAVVLAPAESAVIADEHGGEGVTEAKGVGLPENSSFLWPNGVVYYTVDSNVPSQKRIADAIAHIEANSPIRFRRRTNQANYCHVVSNGNQRWSSSKLGMRGGRQLVRFSDLHGWPILVHEFFHALGVYHEQCRSDRDRFIDIDWTNIQDDAEGNFKKSAASKDYFAYDYNSLMHYGEYNFAKDRSKPVLTPKREGVDIGQRKGLSFGDRQTVAKMYERFFERGYTGVWRAGSGRHALWINASWQSFVSKWKEWNAAGLRLHDIHVRRVRGQDYYSGIFLPGSGEYGLWANTSWDSFHDKWKEWSRKGLRLVDIHVMRVGNTSRYSGVFLPGEGDHGLWANTSWDNFHDKWKEWSHKGLRLHDLHVQRVDGQDRYTGVFLQGSGAHALWASATWPSFVSKWRELSAQGLRLADINVHRVGSGSRYSGVFLPGRDSHYLWSNVTFASLVAKHEELAQQGLRLVDFELPVPEDGGAAGFAAAAMDGAFGFAEQELTPFGGIFEQTVPSAEAGSQPSGIRALQGEGLGGASFGMEGVGSGTVTTVAVPEAASGHGGAHFDESAGGPVEHSEPAPDADGGGAVFAPQRLTDNSTLSNGGVRVA